MLGTIAGGDGESGVSKTIVPQGWSYAAIGDLCTLINGKAFKPSEWADAGLPIIRIQNLNNLNAKFNHFSGDVAPKFIVENGELLFAWSGTPDTSFGAHIWTGGRAILNQHIFRVLFNETLIDKTFFRIAINQKLQELIGKAHGGVGLRHVTKGKFEHTEILLPPLNEQRRIVAKIEALMARSQRVKEALEAIPPLLNQFRQSVLAAAFRGDLTADWREQNPDVEPVLELLKQISLEEAKVKPNNKSQVKLEISGEPYAIPKTWTWTVLDKICNKITDGEHLTPSLANNGIPLLSAKDVRDWDLDFLDTKFVCEEVAKKSRARCNPEKDDVLVVSRGATVGRTCKVKIDKVFCLMGSVLLFKLWKMIVEPSFIELFFKSPFGTNKLSSMSGASAQQAIYIRDMRSFPIPIPPLLEQQEIIRQVQSFFEVADRIELDYKEAKVYLDQLDQSILAKAFRGELVPQDPNDEPASVLLERIQAEREKREAEVKAAKMSTSKTTGRRSRKVKQQDLESIQLGLPGLE